MEDRWRVESNFFHRLALPIAVFKPRSTRVRASPGGRQSLRKLQATQKRSNVRARGGRICDPDQKTARTRHCQCCQKADQQLPGTGEPAIVLGSKMPVATPRKDCTLRCHGAGAMAKFYGSAAEPIARERQATQPLCRCRSLLCDHRLDHVRACDAGQLCTAV